MNNTMEFVRKMPLPQEIKRDYPADKHKAGMVIAVEPMVNVGTWRITMDKQDGWTIRTADGLPSAHFENQILITKHKPEILTCLKTTANISK